MLKLRFEESSLHNCEIMLKDIQMRTMNEMNDEEDGASQYSKSMTYDKIWLTPSVLMHSLKKHAAIVMEETTVMVAIPMEIAMAMVLVALNSLWT